MTERTIRARSFPVSARLIIGCIALLLSGCAAAPVKETRGPVFFPPSPNPPRIQYLATFSEARDASDARSPFADFVLGKRSDAADVVNKPYGVVGHAGKIYVVDTRGSGYAVFDLANKRFYTVTGSGGGTMRKPINMTVDLEGNKYVTDTGRNQVLMYDKDDRFQRAYGTEGQFKPGQAAVLGDRLYVTDLEHHQIHVLDRESGRTVSIIGKAGSRDGELYHPTNIAVSADNHLYVTDTTNFRVQKFSADGKFVRSFGSAGSSVGHFARPKGVALDREGRIYVVDAAFENIQVFDQDGKLLLFFGEPGGKPENLNLPTAIALDYEDVPLFQRYADPKFKLEYVILVASQFGSSKVNAYGYGRMEGADYSAADAAVPGAPPARP
jgi:sugar lactone lactonase YvrE